MKEKYTLFSSYNLIGALVLIVVGSVLYNVVSNLDAIKAAGLAFYAWLNAQSPFLAGAIGLWILGIVTFLSRDIPSRVWEVFVKQTTVTLTMNNVDDVYDHFLQWYHSSGRSAKARTLIAKNKDYEWVDHKEGEFHTMNISAGYGYHYFTFGGKMFRLNREVKEASQTKEVKESLTIQTIGRSQRQFHELLEAIIPPPPSKALTTVYKWNTEYWRKCGMQAARPFDSVILPDRTKDKIVGHIETFLNDRDWYLKNGIPYRTGIILHGVPGTGKTSLVRALCEKFDKPLYILRLGGLSDETLEEAFIELPQNSLILIEDIDTYSVASNREGSKPRIGKDEVAPKQSGEPSSTAISELMGLTMSGLLNSIDGIIASDGRILIATTNHLDKLDPALVRKGRFNVSVEVGYLEHDCVMKFFNNFYPDFVVSDYSQFRRSITPADLQAVIMDNIDNPQVVLDYVKA
jgi:chaperone BCS1